MTEELNRFIPPQLQKLVLNVDHIAIATGNIELALHPYQLLGLTADHFEIVQEQGVRTAFVPVGSVALEFLEPLTSDSSVGKFIARHGEGLHHICLEVADLEAALRLLEANEYQLIDRKPRQGARHMLVAFVHPKGTNGVLLELAMAEKGLSLNT